MKNSSYDIIIVGDGSIGLLSAYKLLSADKNLKVLIISENLKSASKAAGAMHAAFGEIEKNFYDSDHENKILELSLNSRSQYLNYFKNNGGIKKFINSNDTLVYLNKTKNFFEKDNFHMMKSVIKSNKTEKKSNRKLVSCLNNTKIKESILIKDEFSFNPIFFLKSLENKLKKSISFVKGKCIKIKYSKNNSVKVFTNQNETYFASSLIYCGGSNMVNSLFSKKIKNTLFFGVGSALLLKGPPHQLDKYKTCIRTVNRGGSQCGLHVLPYGDGRYYVGAGNYISQNFNDSHRATTLNYLISLAKDEIFGEEYMHYAQSELVLGMRSKTLDGYPMLGPLNPTNNVILASGFNRVGLTLSFEIADLVKKYFFNEPINNFFKSWLPSRDPISYKNMDLAADFFASSRTANLLEHNLINHDKASIKKKYVELYDLSLKLNRKIVKKYNFNKEFILHPDTYRLFVSD